MGVRLMRMDADGGPDIRIAFGDTDDVIPFALARRDVEKALHAAASRCFEHFLLALGQALIVEVAVAIDQPHAAGSGSSSSSRRGKSGVGCSIGAPPSPPSIRPKSFSEEAGMIGCTAAASLRTATTNVPST